MDPEATPHPHLFHTKKLYVDITVCLHTYRHTLLDCDLLLFSFSHCTPTHQSMDSHRGIHLSVVHCALKQVRAAADIDQTDFQHEEVQNHTFQIPLLPATFQ